MLWGGQGLSPIRVQRGVDFACMRFACMQSAASVDPRGVAGEQELLRHRKGRRHSERPEYPEHHHLQSAVAAVFSCQRALDSREGTLRKLWLRPAIIRGETRPAQLPQFSTRARAGCVPHSTHPGRFPNGSCPWRRTKLSGSLRGCASPPPLQRGKCAGHANASAKLAYTVDLSAPPASHGRWDGGR